MRPIDADALIAQCGNWYIEEGTEEGFIGSLKRLIDLMPTIKPEWRWIPCSERLPEDDTFMLVNYIDNRTGAGDIWIGWHEMENVWYIDGEEHSEERGNEVVAWMPLPASWKGDQE